MTNKDDDFDILEDVVIRPVACLETGRRLSVGPDYDDTYRGRPRSHMCDETLLQQILPEIELSDLHKDETKILVNLFAHLTDEQYSALYRASRKSHRKLSDQYYDEDD